MQLTFFCCTYFTIFIVWYFIFLLGTWILYLIFDYFNKLFKGSNWNTCLCKICTVKAIYAVWSKDSFLYFVNFYFVSLQISWSKEKPKMNLYTFNFIYKIIDFIKIIPMRFLMKIKPNMFQKFSNYKAFLL